MAQTDGKVPVLESAAAAVAFLRAHWRFALIVGLIGAAAQIAVAVALRATPFALLGVTFVSAGVYAALIGAALGKSGAPAQQLAADGFRLWRAMALVALFLGFILFALTFLSMGLLMGPYMSELQAVGEDEAQVRAILLRAMTERGALTAAIALVIGAVSLALTSRFYLAGPATVEGSRVRVFETWAWTRGNMWRIAGARLAVLGPAFVLWWALHGMLGAALGFGVTNPFDTAGAVSLATANPGGYLALTFLSLVVQFGLWAALEAGLSSYLYRGLKPQSVPETFA